MTTAKHKLLRKLCFNQFFIDWTRKTNGKTNDLSELITNDQAPNDRYNAALKQNISWRTLEAYATNYLSFLELSDVPLEKRKQFHKLFWRARSDFYKNRDELVLSYLRYAKFKTSKIVHLPAINMAI
jgi:type VI protein secretion system component VasA